MPDWKLVAPGVWSLQVRPSLLSLSVVRSEEKTTDGQEAFWPQINGIVSRRSYGSLSEAQRMAVVGAKKLLSEVLQELANEHK